MPNQKCNLITWSRFFFIHGSINLKVLRKIFKRKLIRISSSFFGEQLHLEASVVSIGWYLFYLFSVCKYRLVIFVEGQSERIFFLTVLGADGYKWPCSIWRSSFTVIGGIMTSWESCFIINITIMFSRTSSSSSSSSLVY